MQRVFRLSLIGMLGIAGLTACGDKISGPEGGNVVHSVTVSPASANMNVGDKVTFAASVDAEAGVTNRTVTWSSSNTAVATVDAATGAATAVAAGTASIIAKSVADPNVSGAAVVSVAAGVPATVTIGQINTTVCGTNGNCTSVPATLNNVANQLDVTLNVDAGTQKLAGVDLIMNCGGADTVVQSQNLASADLAPLSAEEATAPVTLSFNTAAFNAATGAPNFKNGVCTLKARARLQNGTQVASSTQTITLNNIDVVSTTMTTTPSTGQNASASDATGLLWRGGAVNVTVVPVIYSTGSVASASINLVNGGGDNALGKNAAVVGPGGIVATQTGLTPTAGVITASFPNSTSSSSGATGVGGATVDTLVAVVTTVNSAGNAGPSLTQAIAVASGNFIRLDNLAPNIATVAPTVNFNVQNAQNGWIGSTFVFKTSGSGAPIALDTSTTNDFKGVDVVKAITEFSPAGAGTWTAFTSASSLAETSSATAYDLRLKICDALNNCATATNGGLFWQFGVDKTPPSLAQAGGVKDGDVYNIANPTLPQMVFATSDTSNTAGVSGSGTAANAVLVSDQGLKPDSSNASGSRTVCALGTASSASGASRTCTAPVASPGTFTLPAAATTDGQYLMTVTAVDQAGNQSAPIAIKYYVDRDVPTVSGTVAIPATITTNTAFSGLAAQDSMDIAAGNGALTFGGVRIFEAGTATPTGALFDNALTRQATVGVTLATFYRSLNVAAGGTVPGAVGVYPSGVDIRAIDAAGNVGTTVKTVPFADTASLGNRAAISNSSTTNGITTFKIDSVIPNPADPGKVRTFYIDAKAFAAASGNPFTQVCLFYIPQNATQAAVAGAAIGEYVKISCSTSASTVGDFNTTGRFFQWTITWTPPAAFTNSSVPVVAIGNTAGLDALLSDPVTVTVNPTPP